MKIYSNGNVEAVQFIEDSSINGIAIFNDGRVVIKEIAENNGSISINNNGIFSVACAIEKNKNTSNIIDEAIIGEAIVE